MSETNVYTTTNCQTREPDGTVTSLGSGTLFILTDGNGRPHLCRFQGASGSTIFRFDDLAPSAIA